jgi:hypothetical protein
MADGIALGGWALGCFATTRADAADTFRGTTLATGAETYVRPVPDPDRGLVIYEVAYGDQGQEMTPWIWAIVQPADRIGGDPSSCLISMIAWRPAGMSDEDWAAVCRYHDVEILLIQGQLEKNALR